MNKPSYVERVFQWEYLNMSKMSYDQVLSFAAARANELWIAANASKNLPKSGLSATAWINQQLFESTGEMAITLSFYKDGDFIGSKPVLHQNTAEAMEWLISNRSIPASLRPFVAQVVKIEDAKQPEPVKAGDEDYFTTIEDNLAKAVRAIAGSVQGVSVNDNGPNKLLIICGDNHAVVDVPEVITEETYDVWAELIYPLRRDLLPQILGIADKDDIFERVEAYTDMKVVSMRLHSSNPSLIVELGDKTEFEILQCATLGELWRKVRETKNYDFAHMSWMAFKPIHEARIAGIYADEQEDLDARWSSAIVRSGCDVDAEPTVKIDEAARSLFVLVGDKVIGEGIKCPDDEDFRKWLNNGRNFGKKMRNIADANLKMSEEVVMIEESVVVEHVSLPAVIVDAPVVDADLAEHYGPMIESLEPKMQNVVVKAVECMQLLRDNNKALEKIAERMDSIRSVSHEVQPVENVAIEYVSVDPVVEAEAEPEFDPYNDEPVIEVEPEPVIEVEEQKAEWVAPEPLKSVLYTESEQKAIIRKAIGRVYTALAKYGPEIESDEVGIEIERHYMTIGYDVNLTVGGVDLCLFQGSEDECIKWLTDTAASGKVIRQAIKHVNAGGTDTELDGEDFECESKHPFIIYGVEEHQIEILNKSEANLAEKINNAEFDWMKLEHLKKLTERVKSRINKKNMSKRTKGIECIPGYRNNIDEFGGRIYQTPMFNVVDYAGNGTLELVEVESKYEFTESTTERACMMVGGEEMVAEWNVWMRENNILPF